MRSGSVRRQRREKAKIPLTLRASAHIFSRNRQAHEWALGNHKKVMGYGMSDHGYDADLNPVLAAATHGELEILVTLLEAHHILSLADDEFREMRHHAYRAHIHKAYSLHGNIPFIGAFLETLNKITLDYDPSVDIEEKIDHIVENDTIFDALFYREAHKHGSPWTLYVKIRAASDAIIDLYKFKILGKNSSDEEILDEMLNIYYELLDVTKCTPAQNCEYRMVSDVIAKYIRLAGANNVAHDPGDGEGPSYHAIVCDVAERLDAPQGDGDAIESREYSILQTCLEKALADMDDAQKTALMRVLRAETGPGNSAPTDISTAAFMELFRAGGTASHHMLMLTVNYVLGPILTRVTGAGMALVANAPMIARRTSVPTGPADETATGLWTMQQIADPAYQVIIPCVVWIAMLRRQQQSLQCTRIPGQAEINTTQLRPFQGTR